jgi:hypothetical protein
VARTMVHVSTIPSSFALFSSIKQARPALASALPIPSPRPTNMFFTVARLRLAVAAALAVLPVANAHIESICELSSLCSSPQQPSPLTQYTVASSVSYCAPPESLLVEQFDIRYFPFNNSVAFNVSAASVVRALYLDTAATTTDFLILGV